VPLYSFASQYEKLRNASACPTFLLATAGPWLTILGAVITDGVIIQRLTNYIWVGLNSVLSESHITDLARTFFALKMSLKKLTAYYEGLQPTSNPAGTRYFPSITAFRQNTALVDFEYVGYLENGPDCVTLRARTLSGRDIVVKFVERYGRDAHEILAGEGLAPGLLYCGPLHLRDGEPSYRSISMVVMEYIDGFTLSVAKKELDEETMKRVKLEVRRALDLLHDRGIVFGDLRLPNIMITKDGKVKLIDFNWAGRGSQAKYPPLLSRGIAWPEGVGPLAVMKPEHDLDMWSKLF
jgi:serine/threonine protein kinase